MSSSLPSWIKPFEYLLLYLEDLGFFVPVVCVAVDGDNVTVYECTEIRYRVFKQADDAVKAIVPFSHGTILPLVARDALQPISVGDVVAARCDADSMVYEYGVVTMLLTDTQEVVVEIRRGADDCDEEHFTVHRFDVVLVDAGDIIALYKSPDYDADTIVEYGAMCGRNDFAKLVQEWQRKIVAGTLHHVVISPFSDTGLNDLSFYCENEWFSRLVAAEDVYTIEEVVHLYEMSGFVYDKRDRLLHWLTKSGATLICVPAHASQTDLEDTRRVAQWFVAAHCTDVSELINRVVRLSDKQRRMKAMFEIAKVVATAAVAAGRAPNEAHLRLQLLLAVEAGSNAHALCIREGWNWPLLSWRLSLVVDLHWELRIDLKPMDADLLHEYVALCFVDVQKREYALPSDAYIHLLVEYYSTTGDLATEKARRRSTQKVMTENATLRGAKDFIVQRYLAETGQLINPSVSTLYRRMAAKRADSNEGGRHCTIAVDARPRHSGRGNVGNNSNDHFSLAKGRYVREWACNMPQREVASGIGDHSIPLARTQSGICIRSEDDKAKIQLWDTPVRRYRSEWHLLGRDSDGEIIRPTPILKTLSVDQNKHDTVIHHAMLILNEGPQKPNMGTPCGVLSHGSIDRSPAFHSAEFLRHLDTFTPLWCEGDAMFERLLVYSDRGPHENLAALQVILSHRYVMYLLDLKCVVLAAPAVSSYNPVEHVHTATNSALGETPIGVSGSTDGDVMAVARRIATARYNNQRIYNACMFDGGLDEYIPPNVGLFIRGNMKSAKRPAVTSARNLLTDVVPVTPRAAALRTKLKLPALRQITFQQLLNSVVDPSPLVYRSVYMTIIATTEAELANVTIPTPIPRCLVKCANADVDRAIRQRVLADPLHYLTLAESRWLQQRADATVECFDGSMQSLASVANQADVFLPSAMFDAYLRGTPDAQLYAAESITRLCRFTMLEESVVKKEIKHRMDVRASRRAGAIKGAITKAANKKAKSK